MFSHCNCTVREKKAQNTAVLEFVLIFISIFNKVTRSTKLRGTQSSPEFLGIHPTLLEKRFLSQIFLLQWIYSTPSHQQQKSAKLEERFLFVDTP